jgi:hypothetical protein
MPRYQITRVYLVERATEAQALAALDQPEASQYLARSSIEVVPEEHDNSGSTLNPQVLGDTTNASADTVDTGWTTRPS